MKLTKKQFNVLVYLEAEGKSKSQRDIAAATDLSVGTVNRLMTEMTELGYVSGGAITTIGVEALEPYRVKRAVFMAAGLPVVGGVLVMSTLIFLLTRRFGTRLVEVFVSREKINELRFLNTEQKRNTLIFLLFFIPGTPKDLLTYFVGLTDIRLRTFLLLSMVARIPSVLSSTFGGHLLGEERYIGAVILYGVTGLLSLLGLMGYNRYLKKKQ